MADLSRRMLLRQRTAAAHAALDAAAGNFFTDRAGYASYLRAIHAFRAPLEARILAAWPAGTAWHPNRVADLIGADMRDLGVEPSPAPAPEHALQGDRLLGALYVLEGSSLGARVLLGRAEALGLSADFGARHLAALAGNLDGWRGFLTVLEAADPFDADLAVDASMDAFGAARVAFGAS